MKKAPLLHLASASPRRRDLLDQLGVAYSWAGVDIDESPQPGEAPGELVRRLASEKGWAVRSPLPVLSADTIVTLEGDIFGKPACRDDALAMLERLSGRCHEVLTAVALKTGDRQQVRLSATKVRFRDIHPDEARAYWHSGEPRDKAGAYAIQGAGGTLVERIEGDFTATVGLPLKRVAEMLRACGCLIPVDVERLYRERPYPNWVDFG